MTNATAEAIARSERGANEEWKAEVYELIKWLCTQTPEFTSQDVLDHAAYKVTADTHDYRAIGPLMSKARKEGYIVFTGHYIQAEKRHDAPIRVWRSTVYPTPPQSATEMHIRGSI